MAYIESHQCEVFEANQRLSDRLAYQNYITQIEANRVAIRDLRKEIAIFTEEVPVVEVSILQLEGKKIQLQKELAEVETAIAKGQKILSETPGAINKSRSTIATKIWEIQALHKKIKEVPGSADEDNRIIDNVDAIRLRAMKAIQEALGSL